MANKEKQHYVPRFYLKKFSLNNGLRQIGIYIKKKGEFIKSASLKAQAYKSYYYGKDGLLEEGLGMIEDKIAPIVDKICREGHIPKYGSPDHYLLLMFIVSTDLRNPTTSKLFNQTFHSHMKMMLGQSEEFKKLFENGGTLGIENIPQIILRQLDKGMKFCFDLNYKLLINNTTQPFITSDNPVIKYNQFLEGKGWTDSMTGYSSIGLQIILPLSPKIAILFYDTKIYKVGDKKKDVLLIDDTNDVFQINLLQFVNSSNNVFFNQDISETVIKTLSYKYEKIALAHIVNTTEYKNFYDEFGNKKNSSVVFTTFSDCCTKLKIKGLKLTDYAKTMNLDGRAVQLRNSYYYMKNI